MPTSSLKKKEIYHGILKTVFGVVISIITLSADIICMYLGIDV